MKSLILLMSILTIASCSTTNQTRETASDISVSPPTEEGVQTVQTKGSYQAALERALLSEELAVVAHSLRSFQLTSVKIKENKTRSVHSQSFELDLFYSALGTAGGCHVKVHVNKSQMELVGNGEFTIKEFWNVTAKQGICPR